MTAAHTELAQTHHHREAMAIAERRGELIEKSFVSRQSQFVFLCLRAAILNFPSKYARQVVGLPNEHEAKQILTKAAYAFLVELADFPNKAIDSKWLEQSLEADGQNHSDGQPLRPATGAEIRAEQQKAARRRKQKRETMRRLRAKG